MFDNNKEGVVYHKRIKKIFYAHQAFYKLAVLILLSVVIIGMMIVYFFKPTYSVSLNGEFIGYTQKQHSQMLKLVWQAYTKKNQKW